MNRILRFLRNIQIITREIGRTFRVILTTAAGIYGAVQILLKVIR